ncbi:MAG: hypothetical protein GY862_27990 [Gammaproteobacteria bacterium]|nr:hypothetical protein [Gammaproteobacteria bacterium]
MDFFQNLLSDWWNLTLIVSVLLGLFLVWRVLRSRYRHRGDEYILDRDLYSSGYFEDRHRGSSARRTGADSAVGKSKPVEKAAGIDDLKYGDVWLSEETSLDRPMPAAEPQDTQTEQTEPKKDEKKNLIIPLYVKSLHAEGFSGSDVFAVMDQLRLFHGKMRIFHHYGLDNKESEPAPGKQPVFSVASVLEPGTFDPEKVHHFSTPGLVLFMQIPGQLGGRVAFELMLNHAYRMAEILEGDLENEQRHQLDSAKINAIRQRIDDFERGPREIKTST